MFLPPILLNQTHKRRSRITTTISTAHKTNLPPFPVLIFATCALESIQQVDRGRRRCRLFVTINQVGTKRVLRICTKRPLHHQHQAPRAAVHQSAKAPKHQSGPKSTLGMSTSPAGTSTFVKQLWVFPFSDHSFTFNLLPLTRLHSCLNLSFLFTKHKLRSLLKFFSNMSPVRHTRYFIDIANKASVVDVQDFCPIAIYNCTPYQGFNVVGMDGSILVINYQCMIINRIQYIIY